jgi:malate permease and related proteins
MLEINLLKLYVPLVAWVSFGILLGRTLPNVVPVQLGRFLFWIGVPVSIFAFLRQADLSGAVWVAPATAWVAIALGIGLAASWVKVQVHLRRLHNQDQLPAWIPTWLRSSSSTWSKPTQGSFLLSSMVGNTGYLGYPVALALVGPQYFAWALFYDTLGSTLGAYGLGVAIAARFGMSQQNYWQLLQAVLNNPSLWSFVLSLSIRDVPLPEAIEQGLRISAWIIVGLSLLLLGMRLSRLTSWQSLQQASVSLGIKMLIVPLVLGLGLSGLGINGPPHLVLMLQMGMPPAFATLVIAEAYNLDRELTVTALALGTVGVLVTIPLWLWLS